MKRIQFVLLLLLGSQISHAGPLTPQRAAMGGAGRGGHAREGIGANPANVALVTGSHFSVQYLKPELRDRASGGRGWGVSVYDGQNPAVRAGVGTFRESRSANFRGQQVYVDRSEARVAMARGVSGSIIGGVAGRYVTTRGPEGEEKFADGDAGILYPLFGDVMLGLTWENFANHQGEDPQMAGGGLSWAVSEGIRLYADGGRYLAGDEKGRTQWQAGAEVEMVGGFVGRVGIFNEPHRAQQGKSFGAGWGGPRASFDWAVVITSSELREKQQVFGMTVAF